MSTTPAASRTPGKVPVLVLDLAAVPFSRRGCWLNLATPRRAREQPLGPGLYLRSSRARGVSPQREHFLLELVRDGRVVPHRVRATVPPASVPRRAAKW